MYSWMSRLLLNVLAVSLACDTSWLFTPGTQLLHWRYQILCSLNYCIVSLLDYYYHLDILSVRAAYTTALVNAIFLELLYCPSSLYYCIIIFLNVILELLNINMWWYRHHSDLYCDNDWSSFMDTYLLFIYGIVDMGEDWRLRILLIWSSWYVVQCCFTIASLARILVEW